MALILYRYSYSPDDYQMAQTGSRTSSISKVKLFVTVTNRFQPLIIVTKSSILDI